MSDTDHENARATRGGNEVACNMLTVVFRRAKLMGVPPEVLAHETGLRVQDFMVAGGRVDWDPFCKLMENAAAVWSEEELFEIGASITELRWRAPLARFVGIFLNPSDLYVWGGELHKRSTHGIFRGLHDVVTERGPNRIDITTRTLPGYSPCRPLEHIIHGARSAMPLLVGGEQAEIEMIRLDDGARYEIQLRGQGPPKPFRRFLATPILGSEIGHMFRRIHVELNESSLKIDQSYRALVAERSDREHAEQALRISEERFKVLVESAQDLIVEVDDGGRCIYASPSHLEQLGLKPGEMLGKSPVDRIHPDDLAGMIAAPRGDDASRGRYRATYRYRHADGSWIWYESSSSRYQGSDGRGRIVSIARNITERRLLEARAHELEMHEQEERYEALEGKLALETMIADLSRRFLDLPNEDLGDEIHNSLASVGELVDTERAYLYTMDIANSRLEGLFEWFAPEVETDSWIPDSIEKWRERGAAGDELYHWSSRKANKGEIIYAPRVTELPDDAENERRDLLARGVKSYLNIPLLSGRDYVGFFGLETRSRHKNWSEETIVLLGLVGQIIMSALQRKRAEEALRESQRQLIQSQKMEALGRLAGGIAHDFNNMLMVIGGCAEALQHDFDAGEQARQDLEEIQTAARRAGALTQQLLAFSRRQPYLPSPLDLNQIVAGLQSMLARVIGEDIELTTTTESELGSILGDSGQVEQLLLNLAVNARDAMPTGGQLTLHTCNREFDAQEATACELPGPGHYVELSVQDTGVGIDESQRTLIFEPFFTTKEVGRGTGLGLSIVYGIVQQNSGAIEVESVVGEGTTFRIWFPVRGESAPEEEPKAAPFLPDGDATILLVEDEAAVRRLVRRVLEEPGYTILEAGDGEEGVQVASEYEGHIDVVVSDLVMPTKGGVEMATELREARPDLRILFMSGYADERLDELGSLLPGAGILSKPFDSETLLVEVRAQLMAAARARPKA